MSSESGSGASSPDRTNAITDVPGVRVGHTTLISGDGPLRRGEGPVRTGVTIVVPHDGNVWTEPVFAGAHRLNGNGELTGLEWIRESGMLAVQPCGSMGAAPEGVASRRNCSNICAASERFQQA